jgi:hypothetical protein
MSSSDHALTVPPACPGTVAGLGSTVPRAPSLRRGTDTVAEPIQGNPANAVSVPRGGNPW